LTKLEHVDVARIVAKKHKECGCGWYEECGNHFQSSM